MLSRSRMFRFVISQQRDICVTSINSLKIFKSSKASMADIGNNLKPQHFQYFLVLDFEATCDDRKKLHPQEIIEFPVVMLNTETLATEAVFHQYVQPRVHNHLSHFCTNLTGIIQEMVDGQDHIEDVLKKYDKWMEEKLLSKGHTFTFVTCGDWDLKTMLPSQCDYFNIKKPGYFNQWINIKKEYAAATSKYPKGMLAMLDGLSLRLEGRHHSGIDDSKNITRVVVELLKKGHVFKITGRI
ncbi:ERI1 exoribonuclease 3-like isoform X1 [Pecten maximus]|uniref:ERI1 exoribonuclease 3-like isoform X1 n=1 Tax=Pecten maximus TaxID=6579 RepID=UPI001457EC48|nr:ERI1 exoribonuclease 3-like isoform X1 [Pecten maximus]